MNSVSFVAELKDITSKYQLDKAEVAARGREIEKKYADELKRLYEKYDQCDLRFFTILATPSDTRHLSHHVGLFSSPEKAESVLPSSHTSHDSEDGVTWSYQVVMQKKEGRPSLQQLEKSLDHFPSNFPYTGW